MRFHSSHGTAIILSEGKTVATRSDNHFCNGIVFSDHPIKCGQKVCIELAYTNIWSGALRIGFTCDDPAKLGTSELPKYALPHLAKKEGYWIRPVGENLTGDGYQLMFYIGSDGNVQFFVNNEHKGALLVGLPADKAFWVLFDIYGNTKGIRLVKPDDAPKEITARGPDAIKAFESACTSGMKPVYRTRLMLVGQDGAGKTCLKHALLGQRSMKDATVETHGIDLSTSCTFCVGSHDSWTVSGADTQEVTHHQTTMGIMGDVEALEEEYNQALATNIVQELLYQKRRKSSSSSQKPKPNSRDSQRNAATTGGKKLTGKPSSATPSAKFSEIPAEMIKEVPDRVVELVQKMLDNSSIEVKSQESVSMTTRPADGAKMVLNIWDFSGKEVYYATHQVFLTSRALYVIVFNLTHDLEEVNMDSEGNCEKLSTIEYMDFWMRSIYAHASIANKTTADHSTFSPPILIVGTHKDCLHSEKELIDKAVEEKFAQIEEFLVGKPYVQHVVTPFFAVNTTLEDTNLEDLKRKVEDVSCQEPYIGERMPIRWIKFEQEINTLKTQGTHYASYDQVTEVAGHVGVTDYKEVMTMLEFYHDLGTIIYYGSGKTAIDNLLRNTVILNPQWLIDMFKHVISSAWRPDDKWNLIRDKWTRLEEFGILEETLLETLWHEALDQKLLLLGLLEKFDLVCQRLPSVAEMQTADHMNNRSFFVPARLGRYSGANKLFTVGQNDVTFFINFHGFLPSGLFQRILTRTTRWTQDIGGQNPYFLYKQVVRFYLDMEHDFVLEMVPKKYSRIKVIVLRVSDSDKDQTLEKLSAPSPQACAKVRNFLEASLSELREMWMKRISHTVSISCPCERVCETHKTEGCTDQACIHFLNLDECIANKVVMCDYRRIKTAEIKKCFPEPLSLGFNGPVLPYMSLKESSGNIEKHFPSLPSWVKSAAKLLNLAEIGKDWNALAHELGYKHNQINKFNDDLNPGLALLADWIISSGNTGLSVDMLTVYLEKIDREDVVEVIQKAQDLDHEAAQVFISYQWDSQDEVKLIRDTLERSGFTCWMDIGQLGGGDQLYNRIDEAVRHCKAVISCVSPKYVVSSHCMKELSLADLLRKPIIPIMVDKTIWPPPGGMALIFSQLIYINMKGVGGHGGTGIHADKQDKYSEIVQRISLYATPDMSRCIETETDAENKSQYNEHDIMSSNCSMTEAGDHYSMGTRSTVNSAFTSQRMYTRDATENAGVERVTPRTVEEVHVHQCRICTIL